MHVDPKDAAMGVYEKFTVTRTDGRSAPGEKHHGCRYFVLDLDHDWFATAALCAYAAACARDYPALASDIRAMIASAPVAGGMICSTHGKAVLMTHVDDGEPCSDFLRAPRG